MEISKGIGLETVRQFHADFEADFALKAAEHAASKALIDDICYCEEQAKKISCRFSVDIPVLPASDQQDSGRCWIFAALGLLREKAAKKLNLETLELSANYISFYDHLEKANTFLEHVMETADRPTDDRYLSTRLSAPLGDGGWWEYFVGLCSKYGVVPKDAMPETYQSSHTGSLNRLLNMQLREDAAVLRKEYASGETPQQLRKLKFNMLSRVYNIIAICLGTPPAHFDFEYVDRDKNYHADRNLTPAEFYRHYVGMDLDQIVTILNAPAVPYDKVYVTEGEESIYGSYQAKRLNLPPEEFKAAVIRQLQAGEPVWFVCDSDYACNTEDGIWDTGLYDYESLFHLKFQMDKGRELICRQSDLDHAMLLTGVNLVDGKPDKWKVLNSWGREKGHDGFFVLSDSWFDRYVFTAGIESRYLTERQQQLSRQKAAVFPIWNILA